MLNVTQNFKTAMTQPVKEIQAFINYDENSINDSDDLISFKISCDSGLCKTAMRKLEAKYLGSHNLLGKWVKVGFGVRLPDGEFDLVDYGSFLVTELTETKDNETTSIVAYDKMVNAMTPYVKLDVEYPIKLIDYTRLLCEVCGLELSNDIIGDNYINFYDMGYYSKAEGITITPNSTNTLTLNYEGINQSHARYHSEKINIPDGNYNLSCLAECDNEVNIGVGIDRYPKGTTTRDVWYECWFTKNERDKKVRKKVDVPINNELYDYRLVFFASQNEVITSNTAIYKDYILKRTDNLTDYKPYNRMNDWQVTQELWENIEGITYRDIFQQIAQATGTTCIIHDDKVYFKSLTNTGENLTYNNMFKLKLEAPYGEINSVVLSRTPSEDNVYLQNVESIQENGLTEFKIENNEIIDKDRNNAITPIFNALSGITYYPFEATTEGLGWYEIGDNITIVNETGDVFKTSLFNYSITVDGSVKETLKTTAESKTQTQYQYATTIAKQLKNTEFIVNKQEQYIKSLVRDMYEEDGILNEKYTSLEQDIEKFAFNIQNSGGANLIKNSVMFAYDNEDNPYNWVVEGDGTLTRVSDVGFQNNGGLSCHGFMLANKTVRTEKIPVKPFNESNPIYYSFSTKIKKGNYGTCYIKIYNPDVDEEHIIPLTEDEKSELNEYSINGLKPLGEYYIIEFYGSADSNVIFTDNMFAIGENKSQWTQANGEVMNTQVNISLDGIVVRSDTVLGDYTVISKYEFAGYSNVNGTMTKVFTLNKGVTEVKKLLASDEISMPPLKIVPITTGDMQGWAFVIA